MTKSPKNPSRKALDLKYSNGGFSLIITVTMLILLAMISVGLLSLSTTQIRSANSNVHQQEARANARLALQIAIGKLQKYAGSDTRVTASAGILEGSTNINPFSQHWTGVWSTDEQKNEGAAELSNGQPVWLVSGNESDLSPERPATTMSSLGMDITLASATQGSTAGDASAELKAPLESVKNSEQEITGAYAYAISDENLKADVGIDSDTLPRERAKVASISNPSLVEGAGGRPFDGRDWYDSGDNGKIVTLDSLQLVGGGSQANPAVDFQHDLTTYSNSLLTDTRLGGLKLDLTTGLEGTSSNYGRLLRETPHEDLIFAASNEQSDPGGPRWNQLRSFLTNRVAKNVSSGVQARVPTVDDAGFAPVVALMQWGLKVYAVPHKGGTPVDVVNIADARSYSGVTFYSFYCPSLVLWNPYDVDMSLGRIFYQASFRNVEITAGGAVASGFKGFIDNDQPDGQYDGAQVLRMSIDAGTIRAGQTARYGVKNTRLFSDEPSENILEQVDDALSVKGFYHISTNSGRSWGWRGIATASVGFENNFWNAHTSLNLSPEFEPEQKLVSVNHGGWDKDFGGTPYRPTVIGLSELPTEIGSGTIVYGSTPTQATLPNLPGYQEHKHDLLLGLQYFIPFPFSDQVRSPQNFINWRNAATTKSFQIDMLSLGNLRSPLFTRLATIANASRPYGSNPIYLSGGVKNNLGQPFTTWINPGLGTNLGYSMDPGLGVENLILFQQPDTNKVFRSIGELSQANLFNYRDTLNRFGSNNNPICFSPTYAIGNSYSPVLCPLDEKEKDLSPVTQGGEGYFHDYSYKLNEELWDRFFFSTMGQGIAPDGQPENDRIQVRGTPSGQELEDPLEVAKHLRIRGGFNINSISANAWKALLSALRQQEVNSNRVDSGTPFIRFDSPQGQEVGTNPASDDPDSYEGFRVLTDNQISDLAENLAEFINIRCAERNRPFLSVADFVNRSLEGERSGNFEFAKSGVVQQAIDETPGINDEFSDTDERNFDLKDNILITDKALEAITDRKLSTGIPGFLMQSDILSRIGSSIVARGDTFKIRAYGESRSKNGNVVARQFCEAVVERDVEYVDSDNPASERDYERLRPLNRKFGRKFEMISFRWLNEDQI